MHYYSTQKATKTLLHKKAAHKMLVKLSTSLLYNLYKSVESYLNGILSWFATAVLRMRLLHAIVFSK